MSYLNFKSEYDRFPKIKNHKAFCGYEEIYRELKSKMNNNSVVVFDYYPGVDEKEVYELIKRFNFSLEINMHDIFKDGKTMTEQMKYNLTDDRVFGKMYYGNLVDFIDEEKLDEARNKIKEHKESVIVYGVGAGLVSHGDVYVYFDMARWEIQLRYRKGMANYNATNFDEDILKKYKRGYFIEWRIADKHKAERFDCFDYVVDTNVANDPKMISRYTFTESLKQLAQKPFRTVPYFDPGVWGGQWMKEICDLDRETPNFAWCFDCVPEENSLYLGFGEVRFEIPSIDLVFSYPRELLGNPVYGRFGDEFPIRFDFLDTMDGGNLSLQVHPLTQYIQEKFGMHYTQDESYYILDAEEDASVYLGVKDGIVPEEMINALTEAQHTGHFDAEKYVGNYPVKKHDHVLIPAGTVHCSGRNSMVLEISATPYIFTFKLWDWGRLGLDGRPRPINIGHGKHVIQWNRTEPWVRREIYNKIDKVAEGDGWIEEHTGLHECEFIETRRHWFTKPVLHKTDGSVNVLNLVEGREAIVESPTGEFDPFVVHYAETFIIPESVKQYTIRPYGESEGKQCATIKAFVKHNV